MEKFLQFRDKGTGISPFQPLTCCLWNFGGVADIPMYVTRIFLFVVKTPIILVCIAVYAVLPTATIANALCKVINVDFAQSVVGVRKQNVRETQDRMPRAGDLVVANHCLPIDGLLFQAVSKGSISILMPDNEGALKLYTPWSLFKHTFSGIQGPVLSDIAILEGKAVFVLMEGTTSNNRGVLPFVKLDAKSQHMIDSVLESGFVLKTMALKLAPPHLAVPVPIMSVFAYIVELCARLAPAHVKLTVRDDFSKYDIDVLRRSFGDASLSLMGSSLDLDRKSEFFTKYLENANKKSKQL